MTKNNTENTVKTPAAGTPDNPATPDLVNHPPHYAGESVVVECVDIARHLSFCRGNAFKYVWRAGRKGDAVEDIQKAIWYLRRESMAPPSAEAVAVFSLLPISNKPIRNEKDEIASFRWRIMYKIVHGLDALYDAQEYEQFMKDKQRREHEE